MATGIGETLRAARRQQGVSLADAAAETRVRETYLAALEEEDFAALGGDVYVKGFLRSYARFLRLDPEPLVSSYRTQYEQPDDDIAPLRPQAVSPLNESRPGLILGVGAVVAVLALLFLVGIFNGDDPGTEAEQAAVPQTVQTTPPPTEAATEAPTEDPTEDEEVQREPIDGVEVSLDVEGGESWMRVTVDGVKQLEEIVGDGQTLEYQGDEQIEVRLGDPGVVNVTHNGEDLGRIGIAGVATTQVFAADDAG